MKSPERSSTWVVLLEGGSAAFGMAGGRGGAKTEGRKWRRLRGSATSRLKMCQNMTIYLLTERKGEISREKAFQEEERDGFDRPVPQKLRVMR